MEKRRTTEGIERGDHERKGTVWTATAHIVTAVIGSGVLALAWSVAQLGWIAGPLALAGFAGVTYYTSTLLADSYRSPDRITGARNCTYMDAVRSYLGPKEVFMCGVAQYVNLWGTMVGYTITAAASMIAIRRSDCFHRNGHNARCDASGTVLMAVFGLVQVALSQFPSLEKITWLSVVAAAMSFAYSFIGLGLSVGKWASHGDLRGSLAGYTKITATGEQNNEEGCDVWHRSHHNLLPLSRLHRLRCVWRRRSRKHSHRFRVLRAVLASRYREYMHHPPSCRSIPGLCTTNLCCRREANRVAVARSQVHKQGLYHTNSARGMRPVELRALEAGPAVDGRLGNNNSCDGGAVLQRGLRAAWRVQLLAADGLFSDQHAHCAGEDQQANGEVDFVTKLEHAVFVDLSCSQCWFCS